MTNLIDLNEKIYGNLTVLHKTGTGINHYALWKCICTCGNYTEIRSKDLVSGLIDKCEFCYQQYWPNLVGEKFGELIVIKRLKTYRKNRFKWLCVCSCGTKKIYYTGTLKHVKSCGCKRKKENLVNNNYGKLTVIKNVINEKSRQSMWLCECMCGNKTIVNGYSLKIGGTKSCGCLRKKRMPIEILALNKIIDSYKRNAKRKKLKFNLSKKYVLSILNEKCFYCGSSASNTYYAYERKESFIYNGIDRIDNTKGYI